MNPFQVTRERLDPLFIASSSQRMMPVGLVIVRAMIIIVPLFVSFAFNTISFLAPVLNLVVCTTVVNDVVQVPFIPIPAVLTQR
jgi:hypothetical protein